MRTSRRIPFFKSLKQRMGRLTLASLLSSALFPAAQSHTLIAQSVINTVAGSGQENVSGTTANPGFASGIVVDATGNAYLAIADSAVVLRLDVSSGKLSVFAGTGVAGYRGDNGAATSAQLSAPAGLAIDSSGNVYIADAGNNRVREVANGTITTVAGNGNPGYSGDGGAATSAEVNTPLGVTLDGSNNLFILETCVGCEGNILREVSNGIISTIQFCTPTCSRFYFPASGQNFAADASGNLFYADSNDGEVYELSNGVVTVIAGTPGKLGYGGDGGPATAALLNEAKGVALDSSGNLYIADEGNNRIRLVSNGIINTVAGNGTSGSAGDGGNATNANLSAPSLVGLSASGTFYIVDSGNQRLRQVSGGTISTVVGNVTLSGDGDNMPATSAALSLAPSIAVDSQGNIFIAEAGSNRVRKVSGGVITTVAGNGTQGYSGDGGSATNAQLNGPLGLTAAPSGDLYIADTVNNVVRKVTGGTIITVAGNGIQGYSGDGGAATSAELKFPTGLAVDASGNLYIADTGNWVIRKVSGGTISTFAGTPINNYLNSPAGLAFDRSGNLYVADSANSRVIAISQTGTITTVAGVYNTRGYNGDNISATAALLNYPVSVAVDASGTLYIADGLNHRIRKVSNGLITAVVGNGTAGFNGDGGSPTSAELTYPSGIAVDSNGNLYVADTGNKRIRAVSIAPTIANLSPGSAIAGGAAFNLTVNGTNFQTGSLVEWNGAALTSRFVSSTQLTASVTGSLIATVGAANITVVNAQSAPSAQSVFSIVAPFSLSANPTSLTVSAPGGSQNATITLPPASGFSGSVTLACSVAYNGQGTATSPPTCSLSPNPVSVTSPNSGSTTLAVMTTAPQQAKADAPTGRFRGLHVGGGILLIALILTAGSRRRYPCLVLLQTIALAGGLLMMSACGGNGGGGSRGTLVGGTTTGNYTVTVTATSGSYTTNIAVPLTVQ
jgi:trimeric autotransporter adhesin